MVEQAAYSVHSYTWWLLQ